MPRTESSTRAQHECVDCVKTAELDGCVADLDLACIGGFVAAALGICAIVSCGSVRCGSHG